MPRRLAHDLRLQTALVLLIGLVIYWPMLGHSGFSSTEGHRVIPGWEMRQRLASSAASATADAGAQPALADLLIPRMFGQVYLRKPPGMPWAVAISAELFGESEWSARAVSALAATVGPLLSLLFATRWFGRPWGLVAGLSHALTPWFWSPGRSAEIEAMNNLATQAAALLIIDLLAGPAARTPLRGAMRAAAGAAALVVMVLAKGPAGAPVIAAAVIATVLVKKSGRILLRPAFAASLGAAAAVVGVWGWLTLSALRHIGEAAITQGVGDFMWEPRKLIGVLTLPFAATGASLPASLALLFAWSPAGRGVLSPRQRLAESDAPGPSDIARILALTTLLSIAILMIAGVSNPRYTMPAMTLPAILAAHAAAVAHSGLEAKGTRVWNALTLRRPAMLAAGLLVAAFVYVPLSESRRERSSGRAAGLALAEQIPDGAEVWADHLVEARPEVLLYAQRRAEALGRRVTPRWVPASDLSPCPAPPPGGCVLLRTDPASAEEARYRAAGIPMRELATGRVHKFAFSLDQITSP